MNVQQKKQLQELAGKCGTPLLVVDHEKLRQNYLDFRERLPDVQAYFAVKANSDSDIVKTMYDMGASFDVASFREFMMVYNNIKHLPEKERQQYIWDNIIYANTIKHASVLAKLNVYKPLVTFDNKDGKKLKVLDIGGRFPAKYNAESKSFPMLARKLKSEIKRLFKGDVD